MSDDPGHKAAEEVLRLEQDANLDALVDGLARIATKNNATNWTHCVGCYVRRDHIYDEEMEAWRCGFCGVVNNALTQLRKIAAEVAKVAETYLEENPEEE